MYDHPGLVRAYDPDLDNWQGFNFPSREAMLEHLDQKRRVPDIPVIADHYKDVFEPVYTENGLEVIWDKVKYSGVPKYWFIQGHEMDSYWRYPVIEVVQKCGPDRDNVISQAQWHAMQRVKAVREVK